MKINRILSVFLAIGILFSGVLVYQRFDVESDYKTYEVNMYYSELEKMASQDGVSVEETVKMMKDTGITNLLIKEDTVQSLKQNPNYELYTRMKGYDLIIESPDQELIQRILKGYKDVMKSHREVVLEDENTIRVAGSALDYVDASVITAGSYGQKGASTQVWYGSLLETVGVGYEQQAIDLAKKYGYGVTLSPTYYADFQDADKSIDRFFETIDQNEIEPSHIVFSGTQVLGYDFLELKKRQEEEEAGTIKTHPEMERLAKELEDRNIAVTLIESSSQGSYLQTDGMMELIKMMDYEAVGSYLTWDFVINKYDYGIPFHHNGEEIANIMYRGITTRNIRVISMKPFVMNNRYITDPEAYTNVLDNLEGRLAKLDIKPARLKTMEFFNPNKMLKIPVAIGIIAAWLMIVDNIFEIKKKKYLYAVLALGSILVSGVFALGILGGIMDKGFALLGAMAMPTLAGGMLIYMTRELQKDKTQYKKLNSFFRALMVMVAAVALCMGSVLFEMAMLSHSKYLLGIDTFGGVKISQLVPMAMVVIFYVSFFGYKRGYKRNDSGIRLPDIERFCSDSIKMWQVALVGVIGAVLMIFMARSGNTSGEPAMIEVLLRNFLEWIFPARPRTKAIFVGFPAMIAMMYLAYQKRHQYANLVLGIAASIALVNTVNTFSHTKAAIVVSVYRTGAEMLLGVFTGLILIFAIEIIDFVIKKYSTKKEGRVSTNEL